MLLLLIVGVVLLDMYMRGGIYQRAKSSACFWDASFSVHSDKSHFCDIKILKNIVLRPVLKNRLKAISDDPSKSKRVNIARWKAGKTADTQTLFKACPEMVGFYANMANYISNIVGEKVYNTDPRLKKTCVILIYDSKGDFINWHYDVNYYRGRFFTLLIPVSTEDTCTTFVFKNNKGVAEPIRLGKGEAILFEGERSFHMASKLCEGNKRVILSMQFTTNNDFSTDSLLLKIKNIAY
eukprot:gene29475-5822_t